MLDFVLHLHGLWLDSFQTMKTHSYDGYFIYMPSFNSFHPAVYLVCGTDFRPVFRLIGQNSIKLAKIPTKIGTEIHFNKSFVCAKFLGG